MIASARRKALLALAQKLSSGLLRFETPGSGAGVAPSFLAPVIRFLQANPLEDDFKSFLHMMPGSYLAEVSRGAQPQLAEVARQVTAVLRGITSKEEQLYVLGWARRLLGTHEERSSDGAGQRSAGAARPVDGRFSQGGRGRGGPPR